MPIDREQDIKVSKSNCQSFRCQESRQQKFWLQLIGVQQDSRGSRPYRSGELRLPKQQLPIAGYRLKEYVYY